MNMYLLTIYYGMNNKLDTVGLERFQASGPINSIL